MENPRPLTQHGDVRQVGDVMVAEPATAAVRVQRRPRRFLRNERGAAVVYAAGQTVPFPRSARR